MNTSTLMNEQTPVVAAATWTVYAAAAIAAGRSPREAAEVADDMCYHETLRDHQVAASSHKEGVHVTH